MAAPTENEFWRLRKDLSEDGKKLSVEQVYEKAQEYIDYCRNNPLISVDFRGKDIQEVAIPKMRAMTLNGLWIHLGIGSSTWSDWKNDPKYSEVITHVENMFYVQKFEGAAAGMLNPNIIARDLGLVDKKQVEQTDPETLDELEKELNAIKSALFPNE
jgi:hypothetical protein